MEAFQADSPGVPELEFELLGFLNMEAGRCIEASPTRF
jgi:hypothetical protein